MDGEALLATVREETDTELDRLRSDKALLAATDAQLETDAVVRTAMQVLAYAEHMATAWADEAVDDDAGDALREAAETFSAAHEGVAADKTTTDASVDPPFLHLDADGDLERVAVAAVATPLVLDGLFLQGVSFFVNEADTVRADRFRDLRDRSDSLLEEGLEALETICAGEEWERAEAAAVATVEAAYEDYTARLDAMGFDPKPIC